MKVDQEQMLFVRTCLLSVALYLYPCVVEILSASALYYTHE